jgi:hypothetical protein
MEVSGKTSLSLFSLNDAECGHQRRARALLISEPLGCVACGCSGHRFPQRGDEITTVSANVSQSIHDLIAKRLK